MFFAPKARSRCNLRQGAGRGGTRRIVPSCREPLPPSNGPEALPAALWRVRPSHRCCSWRTYVPGPVFNNSNLQPTNIILPSPPPPSVLKRLHVPQPASAEAFLGAAQRLWFDHCESAATIRSRGVGWVKGSAAHGRNLEPSKYLFEPTLTHARPLPSANAPCVPQSGVPQPRQGLRLPDSRAEGRGGAQPRPSPQAPVPRRGRQAARQGAPRGGPDPPPFTRHTKHALVACGAFDCPF